MKVLVFCEQRDRKLKSFSYEALTVAHRMSGGQSENVAALLVGDGVADLAQSLKTWGAGKVLLAENPKLSLYNSFHYTAAIEAAIQAFKPDLVLGVASPMGKDVFARIAARCGPGCASRPQSP